MPKGPYLAVTGRFMHPTTVTTNEPDLRFLDRALVVRFVRPTTGTSNELVREPASMGFVVRYGHHMHVSPARGHGRVRRG